MIITLLIFFAKLAIVAVIAIGAVFALAALLIGRRNRDRRPHE